MYEFRLLKSISNRLAETSSSTPYSKFLKNSIELVHIAKVGDREMNDILFRLKYLGLCRNIYFTSIL
jgi:hypothetical protein